MAPIIMASYKIFYLLFITSNICYELCPFYQLDAASVPPTNTASQGKGGMSRGMIVTVVVPIFVTVLILIVGICYFNKRTCYFNKRTSKKYDSESELNIGNFELLQYDFCTIEAATNNFSADNKVREGRFGEVYKGILVDGQEIAVRRFYRHSRQSVQEFKKEVETLARIKHRNLVTLHGFCMRGEEKILVYEYMPNKSLDHILFNLEYQRELDWTNRYKIVKEIARGLQYLHEDSRLKIIHCDLKVSNILLDSDMNPKIADFGLAVIFTFDQIQESTDRVCGTNGYMAPEYVIHGEISVKCDVYRFGVILMEIISGKKQTQMENDEFLLNRAWRLWEDGKALELVDPTIREYCNPNEVKRCIHIALLCVQEDPTDRPSMSSILVMLESYPLTLPTPLQPAFLEEKEEDKLSTMSMESVYSHVVNATEDNHLEPSKLRSSKEPHHSLV